MTNEEILKHIDHTLLKATAQWAEIKVLCDEAIHLKTASVCIPPSYIKPIRDEYGNNLTVATVIGFPLGYNVSSVKFFEAELAIEQGASEIDMVINLGDVKNAHFDKVLDEIAYIKTACGDKILKVIIETCYLTEEEKIRLCKIVTEAKADYIKTSTGFGSAGATIKDIQLFKQHIGAGVKIKAAGGIKIREDLIGFILAGADRIGTSSAVKLLTGGKAEGY
jgi:deoxyribose-phosphate aldolase